LSDPDTENARPGPLAGVRIADFSRVLSGPLATMLLGDSGAEVLKVERSGIGDESRTWGPPWVGDESTYYLSTNRNKRGIALDLRDEADWRSAHRLAITADVVVENFRPGTMDRLGLGYDVLRRENDRLIYCSISGFGGGPGAHLPGYDFLLQAVGGLMSITGQPDGPPTKVGVALVDVTAGLFAAVGILAALLERERSGRGQRVDVSLLGALLAAQVNQATGYVNTGVAPGRMGNEHPSIAPYGLVDAADAPFVVAVGNERQFRDLVDVIGRPELAEDPRFETNATRIEHREELRVALNDGLRHEPADAWIERLQRVGVPAGGVNDLRGAFELAERLGLGPTFTAERADGTTIAQVANPLRFSASPVRYERLPPHLGEHTAEVFEELDLRACESSTAKD
jgi:crotonobetainyl-CoA:carnitine CoA-transferase CaiB-like acyl-CoA transferase